MEDPKGNGTPAGEDIDLDDVIPVYANNVRFEMTAWDSRVLFGQLMSINTEDRGQIDWHTDVTIPWAQAKLMHLFLGINIALYERENGKISIPAEVMPQALGTPPPGVDAGNQDAIESFRIVQGMIKQFRDAQLGK